MQLLNQKNEKFLKVLSCITYMFVVSFYFKILKSGIVFEILACFFVLGWFSYFLFFYFGKKQIEYYGNYKALDFFKDIKSWISKNVKFKLILKELLMYIPVWFWPSVICSIFFKGKSPNQASVEAMLNFNAYLSINVVIFGPILEEILFRLLPSKFIKNKYLYIIITGVIFAAMHVVGKENPLYFVWHYIADALYYGYRYYKTKNILIPISLHIFNNLIAVILMFS